MVTTGVERTTFSKWDDTISPAEVREDQRGCPFAILDFWGIPGISKQPMPENPFYSPFMSKFIDYRSPALGKPNAWLWVVEQEKVPAVLEDGGGNGLQRGQEQAGGGRKPNFPYTQHGEARAGAYQAEQRFQKDLRNTPPTSQGFVHGVASTRVADGVLHLHPIVSGHRGGDSLQRLQRQQVHVRCNGKSSLAHLRTFVRK